VLRILRRPLPLLLACALVIAILGLVVRGRNGVTDWDADVVDSVAAWRSPFVVDLARALTNLGDLRWAGLGLIAIGVLLVGVRWLRPAAAAVPVLALLLGGALSPLIKAIVERPRPPFELREVVERSSGFPSGHSTQSAAGWVALGLVLALTARTARHGHPAWRWAVAGAGVAVVVGATRVVLSVHSPTDVVGGWTLGVGCAVAVVALARRVGALGGGVD
jgi:membrane-associated phospholipid phosphatase